MTPHGSRPACIASISSKKRLRIMVMPMSLERRCSLVRSAMAPCPTQATMSWLMTWLVIQRPSSPRIGLFQAGTLFCT